MASECRKSCQLSFVFVAKLEKELPMFFALGSPNGSLLGPPHCTDLAVQVEEGSKTQSRFHNFP